ncbi:MAG: hypothetical protein ABJA81_03795 [Nocardioidaceae bacterium]
MTYGSVVESSTSVTDSPAPPVTTSPQPIPGRIGSRDQFPIGTVSLWSSDGRWHGKLITIAVAHPDQFDFYALDLANVPLPTVANAVCADVEGSGQRIDKATKTIIFDCPNRSVYARFSALGEPASTNIPEAHLPLTAYRLKADSDGILYLTEDRLTLNKVASLWH